MLVFGALGPIIRRQCPEGFVLTEWTRQRYGTLTMLYLSFMTLVTLLLYMIAELSALGQVVEALTGLRKLPVIIVQCIITTIYTCTLILLFAPFFPSLFFWGGLVCRPRRLVHAPLFRSWLTDRQQSAASRSPS